MSQRKASKRKSRQDTSLLQNKTVQGIGLILLTLFLAVSLFETQSSSSPTLGGLGSLAGTFLNYLFGFAAWLLIAWLSASTYFRLRSKQSPLTSKLPSSILLLAGAGILDSSGGLIGESLSLLLESAIGTWGSKLLLLSISALCLIKLKGYSNQRITDFFKKVGIDRKQSAESNSTQEQKENFSDNVDSKEQNQERSSGTRSKQVESAPAIKDQQENPLVDTISHEETKHSSKERFDSRPIPASYTIPSFDNLNSVDEHSGPSESELEQTAEDLRKALVGFEIKSKVVDWMIGPMATTFHIELSIGERAKNIENRLTDIERAMGLDEGCIRLAGNVTGKKNTVGIEIPNKQRRICVIKEALSDDSFVNNDKSLPIALGVGIDGDKICEDLTEFPHLMVAGSTGSGKSVALNGIIFSLLFKKTPAELQLVLIDPKAVEFSPYKEIPHLLTDVVTEMEESVDVLQKLCEVMDERYELLETNAVRNIDEYHELVGNTESMPYIVIIIDELADLMMTQGKQVEDLVGRLSQKARAAGMHLVLATQRPTSDVIKGLIKTNVPARLAFRVANNVDSRVIIQEKGAETLMGLGDCLFQTPRKSGLTRIQSPLVTGEEVRNIVNQISG